MPYLVPEQVRRPRPHRVAHELGEEVEPAHEEQVDPGVAREAGEPTAARRLGRGLDPTGVDRIVDRREAHVLGAVALEVEELDRDDGEDDRAEEEAPAATARRPAGLMRGVTRSGRTRSLRTAAIAKPDAIEPTVKFVDHAPMTRPRSCRWNQLAIVPTVPDHPVACARPLTAMSPNSTGSESVTPIASVTRIDRIMPSSTLRRGPSRVPMCEARNWPSAYATR